MTSNTKQLRAVFLAALMVMSVFAGTIAFAGSAAAVAGSISADSSEVQIGEDASFTVSDSDGTGTDAVVFLSGTETITNENETFDGTGSKTTFTVANAPIVDSDLDGTLIGDELTLTVDGGSQTISSVNATTGEVTLSAAPASDTGNVHIEYDSAVESKVVDLSSSPTTVAYTLGGGSASAGDGILQTADGETITAAYWDQSEGVYQKATLTAVSDDTPSYLESVHYKDGSQAKLEISFNEDVTIKNNASLYVDNKKVMTLGQPDSGTNGQVVYNLNDYYTGEVEVKLTDSVIDGSGNSLASTGNKTVDVAPVTVTNTTKVNAYKGSKVAVLAGSVNTNIEVEGTDEDSSFYREGSTGVNSQVFVFDTTNRALDTYRVKIGTATPDNYGNVTVRSLDLNVSVDDLTVTNAVDSGITGTVTASSGGRPVTLELLDSDEETVSTIAADLTGQAEYEYNFSADGLDAGNYTVLVTDNQSGVETESSSIEVSKAGEGSADFQEGIVTDQRGDIANITVDLQNTDTATLTLGSSDVGFRSNVTVVDDSGDGQVSVLFNTYAVTGLSGSLSDSKAESVFAVADSDDTLDEADVDTENSVDSLLEAGEYDLEVQTGTEATPDDVQNVGTLVLEERNTTALTSWTANTDTTLDDSDDVYTAISTNNLTQDNEIAIGDYAVHQLQASGLEGALEDQSASNDTAAFFGLAANGAVNLTVEQTDAGANRDPYMLNLNNNSATVLPDSDNDTYFVVVDTGAVNTNDANRDLEDGDGLTANFTVYEATDLAEEQQTVEDQYEVVTPEHTLDDPYNVSAAAEQTISGETNVAPGTELNLRVRSSGDTQPSFLKTATVYVTENNTFSGTFDFSEQEVDDTYEITVRNGGDTLTVDGTVLESVETETEMTETDAPDTATEEPSTATEEPSTATEEPSTATEEPSTATEEPADTETSTGTPGFGVVVAVTALLAAALLAVRRD
ncbi:PGF-CTERM protein/surface glycoprotein [Halogeometricum rufum]|uniref:PGF-CTERM protein/surface glycoprotein n=1 Tax=Halogeometricum rufum TaxID=553469 RepID=A0A1I6G2J0_9EURY|nr:BGTF surface domain-containing protein [Halogeometricum rufum]SFR36398.1 PGF-CTERM protein/surface glycoprotein [Halogeometricum rufum]